MKMRFTKFLAVAMAAVAITSCSNEEELNTQTGLNPGEARVTFNVGSGKTTTRGALTDGTQIEAVVARLFKKDGAEIKNLQQNLVGTTLTVTVPSGSFTSGEDVEWRLVANTTGYTLTEGTGATDKAKADATVISGNLPTGAVATNYLPAAMTASGALTANTNTTLSATRMTRIPARVIVEKPASASGTIAGYKIQSSNAATQAILYTGAATSATQNGAFTYDVKQDVADVIGYFYPSTNAVKLTITPPTGSPKEVSFTPARNASYKLNITPAATTGPNGVQDFNVELVVWDNDQNIGDVDFNISVNESFTTASGLSVSAGSLVVPNTITANAHTFPIKQLITTKYVLDDVNYTFVVSIVDPKTKANTGNVQIEDLTDNDGNVKLTVPYNYSNSELTGYSINIDILDLKDGNKKVGETQIPIIIKNTVLPVGFTVDMEDVHYMALNSRGTGKIADDVVAWDKVNDEAPSGTTFVEKTISYMKSSIANYDYIAGPNTHMNLMSCPKGFRLPTKAEFLRFTGGASKLYVVNREEMEETATDYKVGLFATGLSDNQKGSYRKASYKNNEITLPVLHIFGGIGGFKLYDIRGVAMSMLPSNLEYLVEDAASPYLSWRCVKDFTANVLW